MLGRNAWIWMAAAFCASLGLAVGIVAVLGIERGVDVALAATARLAFLILWPAYAGGALASLFGERLFALAGARPRPRLGVCRCAIRTPRACCLPVRYRTRARRADLRHFWRRCGFHLSSRASLDPADAAGAASETLAACSRSGNELHSLCIFLLDFAKFPSNNLRDVIKDLPFAALGFVGPILKLAAWAQ